MVSFNLRFYILMVVITWNMTISFAQFFPVGGFGSGGGGFPIGQNSFSSQNTNFNQNRRGFGLIAGFGGASSTNFNQNNVQSNSAGGFFRDSQQENTIDEMQARYASPYDLPQYAPKPHPYHAPAAFHYNSPVVPCPSNVLVSCAPQVTHVPCSNPSY